MIDILRHVALPLRGHKLLLSNVAKAKPREQDYLTSSKVSFESDPTDDLTCSPEQVHGPGDMALVCYWLGVGNWSPLSCQEVHRQVRRTRIPAV
jgi:hypothetical protein